MLDKSPAQVYHCISTIEHKEKRTNENDSAMDYLHFLYNSNLLNMFLLYMIFFLQE